MLQSCFKFYRGYDIIWDYGLNGPKMILFSRWAFDKFYQVWHVAPSIEDMSASTSGASLTIRDEHRIEMFWWRVNRRRPYNEARYGTGQNALTISDDFICFDGAGALIRPSAANIAVVHATPRHDVSILPALYLFPKRFLIR